MARYCSSLSRSACSARLPCGDVAADVQHVRRAAVPDRHAAQLELVARAVAPQQRRFQHDRLAAQRAPMQRADRRRDLGRVGEARGSTPSTSSRL